MLCRDLVHNSVPEEADPESDWDMDIDVVGLDPPAKTGDLAPCQSCDFPASDVPSTLHMEVHHERTLHIAWEHAFCHIMTYSACVQM